MTRSREVVWALLTLIAVVAITRALSRVAPPCPYSIRGIRPGMTRAEVARLQGIRLGGSSTMPDCIYEPQKESIGVAFKDDRVDFVRGSSIERGNEVLCAPEGFNSGSLRISRYADIDFLNQHRVFFTKDASLHVHEGKIYHGRFFNVFLATDEPGRYFLTAKQGEFVEDY